MQWGEGGGGGVLYFGGPQVKDERAMRHLEGSKGK